MESFEYMFVTIAVYYKDEYMNLTSKTTSNRFRSGEKDTDQTWPE